MHIYKNNSENAENVTLHSAASCVLSDCSSLRRECTNSDIHVVVSLSALYQMGNTLLMLAIRRPIYRDISKNLAILLETVRFLIEAGANLNIQKAVSPKHHKLMHVCMESILCYFVQTGKTALIFAAKMERLDHAKALIEAGADVDIQDEVSISRISSVSEYHISFLFKEKGWSAIFYAAENGDLPMAEQLCRAGANLSLLDKVMAMDIL